MKSISETVERASKRPDIINQDRKNLSKGG
jgi:hypothetical protein